MALEVIHEKLHSQEVQNFLRGKKKTDNLLNTLLIKLRSLNNVYDDTEDKQLTNSTVRKWLSDLKEAIFDGEDLLDKIKTEALRRKLEAADGSGNGIITKVQQLISTLFHTFDGSVDTKIEEIIKSLDFIAPHKDVLELKPGAKPFFYTRPSTSLVEESSVYGRDEDKDIILKLLLPNGPLPWVCDSDDATGNKIDVIPIVGMGGIGKTTLAQLVYNDEKVTRHFNLRSWVCVSDDFDVFKITQTIYMSVPFHAKCENPNDLNELQVKLKESLTGKKFLFVLDDVWNENYDYWNFLRRPFESGACGSKIIVTTRNEGVASVMGTLQTHHLQDISDEDCWKLFAKHAFANKMVSAYPNLEVIGRKIVSKCKGLPLAAKSLGGLLRSISKDEEWRNVLESHIWELPEKKCNILPALWLSYRYLPPHLKRCFAYSSIYPKDYQFKKTELVLLWMAEDLLQPKQKKMVEEVGEDYFNDLVSRSFFQRRSKDDYDSSVFTIHDRKTHHFLWSYFQRRSKDDYDSSVFTMHDLVNDLAMFVSGGFCVRQENNDSLNITRKTRHFSYMKDDNISFFLGNKDDNIDLEKIEALYEAKCMRTFLHLSLWKTESSKFVKVLPDLLLKFQCLRALNLSRNGIRELPDSVSKLLHLRYLDLSYNRNIEKLPDAVCRLYNLQTLLLSYCVALAQLPTGLGRLIHLRHVDFRDTKLAKIPSEMCKLKGLQRFPLEKFVLDNESNIEDLKELQELHGKLHISGLDNVIHAGDALGANMREKKYLAELVLEWQWGRHTDDSRKDQEVLDNLRPHTNIRKVEIMNYGGINFPAWLGDDCFSLPEEMRTTLTSLRSIKICDCPKLELFPEGGLPCKLEKLRISSCINLRSLPEKMRTTLTSLRSIKICYCPQLESFPHGGLPCKLERLQILECENLRSLPEEMRTTLTNLRSIRIRDCPKLELFPEGGLPCKLETLTISYCKNLRSLPEEMRTTLTSLMSIVIYYCPELESFPGGGLPCKLETLSISDCGKLVENRMQWGLLQLTSLRILDIEFLRCEEEIGSFPDEGLLPTTLTELKFGGLLNLKTINSKELKRLISLKSLTIKDCPQLLCLPDDGLPISLSCLDICGCPLVGERCEEDKGEDWPKIAHIPSKSIRSLGPKSSFYS